MPVEGDGLVVFGIDQQGRGGGDRFHGGIRQQSLPQSAPLIPLVYRQPSDTDNGHGVGRLVVSGGKSGVWTLADAMV